jgi:ABC-2 type transport system permease protein
MHRIWAIVIRHMYAYQRNFDRLTDSFYWPLMDILIWGLTSAWIQKSQTGVPHVVSVLLTGLVFWQIVWRGNYEISVNMLEEFWNQNLVNLFSTPLKLSEWITSAIILSVIKMFITVTVCIIAVYFFYATNLFSLGWYLIPFIISLLMSGWIMGFLGSSIIIYYGQKVQTIAWTMGFLFAPFSAVYYPLDQLPAWVQRISLWLPTTYIFEGMRAVIFTGRLDMTMLLKSFLLNIIYLVGALKLFAFMFEKSRAKGLARLE